MSRRRILLTTALPYANAPIHLGHLAEHVQADVWARFQRLRGHEILHVCGDDQHGTAIMLRARKEGRPGQETALIAEMQAAHERDFAAFQIAFDHYTGTDTETNRAICHAVWRSLRAAGMVHARGVEQFYDPEAGLFLADRYVRGTCPRCGARDQYGDSCEACGATYSPTDLKDPVSAITGAVPKRREAEHLFIEIEGLRPFLREWTAAAGHLQQEVANYLAHNFLAEALRDWDVSRPPPYFGFEIPDAPGHYWYVWFDAPIGYLAATQEWCAANGSSLDDWWRSDEVEIHHVIGKDIVYFHTLFWPSMLRTAGFQLPRHVHVHGFLTMNGAKMSKSRGTFVLASTWLEHLDPSTLRYFLASKLSGGVDDFDLGADEFVHKVNSDLVGKVVNLASRTARFVEGTELTATWPVDDGLFAHAATEGERIAEAYERYDSALACRLVMALADQANAWVERKEPWRLRKETGREREVREVCTVALNAFRQIALYLAPVLPDLAERTRALLGAPLVRWDEAAAPQLGTPVAKFVPMLRRVEASQLEAMFAASRAE
jgi:methionyl-tRNA synthetase